jgi:hypothetical protein
VKQAGRLAVTVLTAGLVLVGAVGPRPQPVWAQGGPTYQGKSLEEWTTVAVNDLDPGYRAAAMDVVVRFGPGAIPHLKKLLESERPRAMTVATTALIRIGGEGPAIVKLRFGDKRRENLTAVIEGVADSGDAGRAFIPHLQSVASFPELFLAASHALSKLGVDLPESPQHAAAERTWEGAGAAITMATPTCFVGGKHSLLRLRVKLAEGNALRSARLVFTGELSKRYVYVEATGGGSGADRSYEARLPRPLLDLKRESAVAIHYFVEIETAQGTLRSDEFSGPVKASLDDCAAIGALAAELSPDQRTRIKLHAYSGTTKK